MSNQPKDYNVCALLEKFAKSGGDKPAIHVPTGRSSAGKTIYKTHTFGELYNEVTNLADHLTDFGVRENLKVLLMVPPGFDFLSITFALFHVGAIPILIDPGMGKSNLLDCVKNSRPESMIAIAKAHYARLAYRKYFTSVKHKICVGGSFIPGLANLENLRGVGGHNQPILRDADDVSAILFTTGSTGSPKGVLYTHGIFSAQVKILENEYNLTPDDIDLPAFPLFALFSTAIGMSVVIPEMDPTRPAEVDPEKIVNAINEQKVTFTFGSPAIWRKIGRWAARQKVSMPSLKKVVMAGAPVEKEIHENLLRSGVIAEGGDTHTPYGATEALPVTDITGREVLRETAVKTSEGAGVCVGRPIDGMKIFIIPISDEPIENFDDVKAFEKFEIGEVVAKGVVVTPSYLNMNDATRMAKIVDTDGAILHRMGDAGYLDDEGRLWFCGRVKHRVVTATKTLYTIKIEAVFNRHPQITRTALVGIGEPGNQLPVLIAEPLDYEKIDKQKVSEELFEVGSKNDECLLIADILFHEKFPTDIRHNAKIFREKLAVWAEDKIDKTYKASR